MWNGRRWFPRSLSSGQRVRHPAIPLRHRRGYAVDIHHGLPAQASKTRPGVPARQGGQARTATQPTSAGLELVASSRGVRHRFLAYTFPSCSPHPAHPAVLNRRDFVEAAPTLPGDPRIRLPPALFRRYDGEEMAVFHPHPEMTAPRGALEADVGAQVARRPFISGHTSAFHTATASSSRSIACRTGT
jgi:hypothetical protein